MGGFATARRWCARAACLVGALCLPAAALAHADVTELLQRAQADAAAHPRDPEAHLQYARALQLGGDVDAALAELDIAARRGADADDVDAARGAVLLDAQRPQAALREFDRLLQRRPTAHAVRFQRGRAYLALGDAAQAARDFEAALTALPEPQPEQVLLWRDALLRLGRPAEAIGALDAGMARLGSIVALQMAAVELEVQDGRVDAAVARLDALLAAGGRNPAWLAQRGDILAAAGRLGAARDSYQQALDVIDTHASARRAHALNDLRDRLAAALTSPPRGSAPCAAPPARSSP
ncbi:MAG: tetratricopeptide repeat protein [bacterium]